MGFPNALMSCAQTSNAKSASNIQETYGTLFPKAAAWYSATRHNLFHIGPLTSETVLPKQNKTKQNDELGFGNLLSTQFKVQKALFNTTISLIVYKHWRKTDPSISEDA